MLVKDEKSVLTHSKAKKHDQKFCSPDFWHGGDWGDTFLLAEHDLLLASAEIDGYLAKRYTVPVTSAGAADLLRDFAIGLAAPKAYFRQASGDLPEKVKLRAEEIRKILRDFSTGAALLAADAVPQQKGQSGLLDIVCDEKRFSRDTMRGY